MGKSKAKNKGSKPQQQPQQHRHRERPNPKQRDGDSGAGGGKITTTPTATNRPKNHLITDATSPYTFSLVRYGSVQSVTVRQTPADETWPGGALWDVGVLLAHVLVMTNCPPPPSSLSSSSPSSPSSPSPSSFIPRLVAPGVWGGGVGGIRNSRVLELGCGVGLTGLVAGALGARAVLLTDLDVVIDEVTRPNVILNEGVLCGGKGGGGGGRNGGGARNERKSLASVGNVAAVPLCWGNEEDEADAAAALDELAAPRSSVVCGSGRKKKKKHQKQRQKQQASNMNKIEEEGGCACVSGAPTAASSSSSPLSPPSSSRSGIPDVLLIGDVAYQHKPGAPSHFDDLLSTVLKFTDEHTVVVFGTRMRMPASADLLTMFRTYFDEVVQPPIEAHEVDPSFVTEVLGRRHNITIHVMKRRAAAVVGTQTGNSANGSDGPGDSVDAQ